MLYPGWRSFFSSLFCHALFQSRNFCGTFFISAIDFCLQDSLFFYSSYFGSRFSAPAVYLPGGSDLPAQRQALRFDDAYGAYR